MAPEQAVGTAGVITTAVDVYGLGAILYEALTGRPPFRAETDVATLSQILHEDPVTPRRLQPTIPRDLETICLKCLRKEPGRRYASAQELADDLRRFRTEESIQARPVGMAERVVRWCRRKPVVAGLLTALLFVFLAGLSGVLVLWRRDRYHAAEAERNADDFKREWEIAQEQRQRAEGHLRSVKERTDSLTQLGRDLCQRPGLSAAGRAVLQEALTFYEQLLPEERSNPKVCLQAARLYGTVADIHHTLGQWGKAVEAFNRQAELLSEVLAQEGPNPAHRHELASSHRRRGNALRDLGKLTEARAAYSAAAELLEQLLGEAPETAESKVALANTLLNKAGVLSATEEPEALERLHNRILKLLGDAVAAAPKNPGYKAELALALESQGLFFLNTGHGTRALSLIDDALTIRKELLSRAKMGRDFDRYLGRNYANLGRAQAAAGRPGPAEQSYREGIAHLEGLVAEFPNTPFHSIDLALTLSSLAEFLEGRQRQPEADQIRRRLVSHYEQLIANFPEHVQSYVLLGAALWDLGRYAEAVELFRKALKRDPESPMALNSLAWSLATSPEAVSRNPAEAVRLAQTAVEASPQTGVYWNTLGVAHYRCGEYQASLADVEKAMRLRQGGDSFDWFFVAMLHGHLGASAEAHKWFDRAVAWMDKHQPHNAELRRFRAEAEELLTQMNKPYP
jgi:tetratricopeptide (TPR) repeat protein